MFFKLKLAATSLRCAPPNPHHALRLSRFLTPRIISMSTSQASDRIKLFDESMTSVKINDRDDGEAFMCDEEPHVLSYEQGYGYYPLTLGQQLGKGPKLEIVRKLGWGGYSSVWLGRTLGNTYPVEYVAVKVLTVNATSGVVYGLQGEVHALKIIQNAKPDHPGYKHCLHLHGTFVTSGPHGPNLCIVTDVLGENMSSLRSRQPNGRTFSAAITKRIIRQTLLALDYLHRECGLVHTDVKPQNTLLFLENEAETIRRLLLESPSVTYEPRIEPDLSPDPIITVKSQPLPNFHLEQDGSNLNICLIDYGVATPIKKHLSEGVQPTLLRAPEVMLGHAWSTPIDIWSVGCLVFEYLTGVALFRLYETSSMTLEHVHLQRIFELIGPFPSSFLESCPRRPEFFDETGSLLRTYKLDPTPIEKCIRNYNTQDEKDISPAAHFIRRCLTIDPSVRPTALELLDDEWLKDA